MTDSSNAIPEALKDIASDIDKLSVDPRIIAVEQPILARIPKKVRGYIYDAGKVAGLAGAAGFAVAGALEGTPSLYATAVAGLLLALSGAVSKAHLV